MAEQYPTFIIVRDRIEPLRQLLDWLDRAGQREIWLIDNDSTYPPLVEFLAATAGQIMSHKITAKEQSGTLSISAADKHGNFAAVTLTHGNAYGAQVMVDGLGLTLGHGMSRFDLQPGHPNAPAPGKKPLINMAPVLITRGGKPILAIGGRGGRRIPNSMLHFLTQSVVQGKSLNASMTSPRFHTEGTPRRRV